MSQISVQDTTRSSSRFSLRNSSRRTHPCPDEAFDPYPVSGTKDSTRSRRPQLVWRVLGLHDLKNPEVWSGAAAEFIGMSCYEFLFVISYKTCFEAGFKHPKLVAAIVQTVVWGICILGTSLFSRQQQHLNSSFTFVTVLTGHISATRAILYLATQCGGSSLGAFGAREVLLEKTAKVHACVLDGLSNKAGALTEFAFTFVLIFVAFPLGLDYKRNPIQSEKDLVLGSFIVGGVLGLLEFISGGLKPQNTGYRGAGMNPARCLGLAVLDTHETGAVWKEHWIFWVGPLAAALAFAVLYCTALGKEQQQNEEAVHHPLQDAQAGFVNQQRRMDVVLHIKAVMHRNDSDRFSLPLPLEV